MSTIATYTYFTVERREPARGLKMPTFIARNIRSGDIIAEIKWHGAWRSYCAFPADATVWSKGCLGDLQAFIETIVP